ncbi:PepSY domain-containing protein [Sphingomicrobium astaxanthinifaciens]|uniref:PepSY domain-containing protein n=1 Tax=Sphingomicrobium astaxanthinifaciens TaxID=1227949 RepID=UPI001FCA4AC3|nr:PepSY domain-containing protein [Sphingomicrobium astaxanthinifaciens]MCJ7421613.1 PepSY domain-containing protein [Sphingomicrobium astaxanthinifaciens]
MTKTILAALGASLLLTLPASPAEATGKMRCDVAEADRQPLEKLTAKLAAEGWQVRKGKVDGGCYEVYATDPEGRRVEAYFDPQTFEKLLVSQRGKELFRAAGR